LILIIAKNSLDCGTVVETWFHEIRFCGDPSMAHFQVNITNQGWCEKEMLVNSTGVIQITRLGMTITRCFQAEYEEHE
jgi:hypothetical protein